jgi:hypothetical protein
MKPAGLLKYHLTIPILAGALGWAVAAGYDDREAGLRATHQQAQAAQQLAWAQDDAAQALAQEDQARELQKQRAAGWIQALGGPVSAAVKDPALNLRQMIEQTAVACAPPGTRAAVTADRFTEFDVALQLPDAVPTGKLAEISKSLLENTTPYVHSLRMIAADEVLAHLEPAAIASVTNWNTVRTDAVKALILAADGPEPASAATATNQPSVDDLNPVLAAYQEAQKAFQAHFKDHIARLDEVPNSLNQASQIETVRSPAQFKAAMAYLEKLSGQLAADRKFFLNPSADLEATCLEHNLDPLLISILKREFERQNHGAAALYAGAFDALSAYLDQIRAFLTAMDEKRGDWNVAPGTGLIQFSTQETRELYIQESGLLEQGSKTVVSAFDALAKFKPAD